MKKHLRYLFEGFKEVLVPISIILVPAILVMIHPYVLGIAVLLGISYMYGKDKLHSKE